MQIDHIFLYDHHVKNAKSLVRVFLIAASLFVSLVPTSPAYSVGFFFDPVINLSNTANFALDAQIAVSGSNVYVVWQDGDGATDDIFFKRSTDSGSTFDPAVNLSNNFGLSSSPKIAVSRSSVYVVWTDDDSGDSEILFQLSTDSGATFNGGSPVGSPTNLSDTVGVQSIMPQISVSGSNVYVVWSEDDFVNSEILFQRSTDSGATFNGGSPVGSPINLSNTAANSILPQVSAAGTNVAVVWQDGAGATDDILFQRSTDSGATFNGGSPVSSPTNLSSNSGLSQTPQIVVSGSNMYVVWQDPTSGNDEILFQRSTDSGATFNGGSPVGSPTNLSSNSGSSVLPQIAVSGTSVYVVWRDSTPSNNDIFFKSSADSGATFGGFVNLSNNAEDSTNPRVVASPSNVFVGWENEAATVPPIDIFFRKGTPSTIDIVYDASQYKLTDTAGITVTATDYDTNPLVAETISVTVTSTSDPAGITIILTETGINTGTFTGSHTFIAPPGPSSGSILMADVGNTITATFAGQTGTAAIFPRTVSFSLLGYTMSDTAILTVFDQNSNSNPLVAETISVTVTSTSDPAGITIILTETGINTGTFTGSHTFIAPPGPSSGSILMADVGNTITASYLGATGTTTVIVGVIPGGGGGGVVINPGLVFDAAGGGYRPSLFAFTGLITDPSKTIMPSHDPSIDFPLSIDEDGFALSSYSNKISTRTKTTHDPVKVQLVFYDPNEMQHIALYTNLRGIAREIQNSDTYIIYDKGKPIEIIDPNHLFSDAKLNTSKDGARNAFVFEITFVKPMPQSDIILRAWDDHLVSADTKIFDAWQVVPGPEQTSKTEPASGIPSWIKNNAKWWSEGSIGDTDFVQGIQYLVKEGVMKVPATKAVESSEQTIPSWIKSNAKWWADGEISDDDFVLGIQYLISHGIMRI